MVRSYGGRSCSKTDVPYIAWLIDISAHDDDLLNTKESLWILGSSNRQIGQRANSGDRDCVRLVFAEEA